MKAADAVFSALTAAIVLTACGGENKPAGADAYPVKIETIEGIRTVFNPAFPKDGVVRYALQDDLTLGGEAEGAESVLNRPLDLEVDVQGNI
jgi:hypothetical protein